MWNGETLETAVDTLELIELGVVKAEVCRPHNKIQYITQLSYYYTISTNNTSTASN